MDDVPPLLAAIRKLRDDPPDGYRPRTLALPHWAYDEMDVFYVERCTHADNDVCSVCR